eukprot:1144964-Pelagomonas_calceolata.AAC.7
MTILCSVIALRNGTHVRLHTLACTHTHSTKEGQAHLSQVAHSFGEQVKLLLHGRSEAMHGLSGVLQMQAKVHTNCKRGSKKEMVYWMEQLTDLLMSCECQPMRTAIAIKGTQKNKIHCYRMKLLNNSERSGKS